MPKIGYFIVGTIASIGNGFIYPLFTIYFSDVIVVLAEFDTDPSQARKQAN